MSKAAYLVPRYHSTLYTDKDPVPQDKGFAAEIFHRLYSESPNELPATQGNAARRKMHSLIDELPEFDTLRHLTTRDPMWASLATSNLGTKIAKHTPKSSNVEKAESILAGLEMMLSDNPNNVKIQTSLDRAKTALQAAIAEDEASAQGIDESAVRNALRAAIDDATQDIQDGQSALALLGHSPTHSPPGVALELAKRVKSSPKLQDIIALAGKLTRTARAKRAARSEYARSEVVGVELTDDVSRLLGSELAMLNDPDMSDDLLIRLTEKRALGFKMRGKEKLAKGPIVLMLDQSGSMLDNNKDTWAKAIALAIYDTARQDKRDFAVVLYNEGVIQATKVNDPATMLEIISSYPGGGTSYTAAMRKSLDLASSKSDIVHITDGQASSNGADLALRDAEVLNTRIYGIGIGPYAPTAWSHQTTKIDDVNKDSPAMDLLFGDNGL